MRKYISARRGKFFGAVVNIIADSREIFRQNRFNKRFAVVERIRIQRSYFRRNRDGFQRNAVSERRRADGIKSAVFRKLHRFQTKAIVKSLLFDDSYAHGNNHLFQSGFSCKHAGFQRGNALFDFKRFGNVA